MLLASGVPVRDVAGNLGVSVPTLYYGFPRPRLIERTPAPTASVTEKATVITDPALVCL